MDLETAFYVEKLVKEIEPILHGNGPDVQGAVLADLLAIYLAGFPQQARKRILEAHIFGMYPLIAVNEKILFGEAGHPYNSKEKEPNDA